jgi:hypothetical protein
VEQWCDGADRSSVVIVFVFNLALAHEHLGICMMFPDWEPDTL